MKQTHFHVFIPKKKFVRVQERRSGCCCRDADESAAVCFQEGTQSSIKHLNENSEGEEKSSQIAVKYHSLLPPYRINI